MITKFNPEYSIRKEDYMKNKDEDIEEMLLSQASLDDLIKMKIEAEFKDEMQRAKELEAQRQPRVYTKISEAPKEYIFSKYAVYKFTHTFSNFIYASSVENVLISPLRILFRMLF